VFYTIHLDSVPTYTWAPFRFSILGLDQFQAEVACLWLTHGQFTTAIENMKAIYKTDVNKNLSTDTQKVEHATQVW
jgi:hypothetical protein